MIIDCTASSMTGDVLTLLPNSFHHNVPHRYQQSIYQSWMWEAKFKWNQNGSIFSVVCTYIVKKKNSHVQYCRTGETWFTVYSLKVFYFLLYRRRYFFFLNWFSTRVRDDQKYLCGSRLYACINTWKFKGLDSREITSLSDIKKAIYRARHFNHRWK